MSEFYFYTLFLIIGVALCGWFLWRRARRGSGFQARLALLFFLFVLLPTIPLILSVSYLFTKSAQIFMLPGIEEALSQSIDLIRLQMREQGKTFFIDHPNVRKLDQRILEQRGIVYLGEISSARDSLQVLFLMKNHQIALDYHLPPQEDLKWASSREQAHHIVLLEEKRLFEYYETAGDSLVKFVAFMIPDSLIIAKSKIAWALRSYGSLKLLRDTFLSQGLIWFLATVIITILALISLSLARLVSHEVSEPIQKLTEGMKKIGEGDLSHQVVTRAKDELAFLVEQFNRMTRELQSTRDSLQRAERAAAWRDVARQISHEIKNPLTPIQFSLYRIKNNLPAEYLQNTEFAESLRMIEEEITSMRRLADEFSEFARLPRLLLKEENVLEILRSAIQLYESNEKKVRFQCSWPVTVPTQMLDREQLRRAIGNLIKNAIEASPPDGNVTISATVLVKKRQKIRIEISDQGPGMDGETQRRIFDPYFTTKKEGSGLGLFIVQKIITEHEGTIRLQSKLGQGTRFIIEL